MASHRKLGKATDMRMALLKNQVSQLLWNGKLETTEARAKEVQKLAEKYITLAVNTYKDTVEVTKTKIVGGKETTVTVINDGANKLAARRTLMANLADLKETRQNKESKTEYKLRTKTVRHPLIEKMFNDYAPKFDEKAQQTGQKGGYTAIYKMTQRRGDGAEMALIVVL
ncbi:MAG: bL17 family ribosomal protein [Clostridia bacterium]|nr:bL17 family ribosomal protein [Clostridia bacterium]